MGRKRVEVVILASDRSDSQPGGGTKRGDTDSLLQMKLDTNNPEMPDLTSVTLSTTVTESHRSLV